MSIESPRRNHAARKLDENAMAENPIEQFRVWYHEAERLCPADWLEVNSMALATSSASGYVTVRIVLLKEFGEDGFTFYTNYGSVKGRQLAENPRAALCLHWEYIERQVRVEGTIERVSRDQSESYFHSRPRRSQVGAVASHQSEVIPSREALEQAVAALERQYAGKPVPLPDDWGGYRVIPARIEFWQGQEDRLHDRILYVRDSETQQWTRHRLGP
jgi:pyridoxamine 5'-phosphate oxidase